MDATASEITTEHMGISYRFCSLQCMENFADHPNLYLAVKSPKRQGKSVIKKRSFTLETPIPKSGWDALETDICNMMGIRDLQVSGTKVSVTYDLLEATAMQVEQCLEQAGAKLGAGWADRLKRGWIHYTEVTNGILSTFAFSMMPDPERIIVRGMRALATDGRWAVLDLSIPAGPSGCLAPLFLAITGPFGIDEAWIRQRPWERIQQLLDGPRLDLYLGFAYIATAAKKEVRYAEA